MMKRSKKGIIIHAPVERVFSYMDDLAKTGMHMSERSMMIMGGKLKLEHVSGPERGEGSTYRWAGRVLGLPVDFTETVTRWRENEEKVWETTGAPRMIILGWYRMHLATGRAENGTRAALEIEYTPPDGFFYRLLSAAFARWYAEWCLGKMLGDAKKALEN